MSTPWPLFPIVVLFGYAGLAGIGVALAMPDIIHPPDCSGWNGIGCGIERAVLLFALVVGVPAGIAAIALWRDHRYAWHAGLLVHVAIVVAALVAIAPWLTAIDDLEWAGTMLEAALPIGLSVTSAILLWRARDLRPMAV